MIVVVESEAALHCNALRCTVLSRAVLALIALRLLKLALILSSSAHQKLRDKRGLCAVASVLVPTNGGGKRHR